MNPEEQPSQNQGNNFFQAVENAAPEQLDVQTTKTGDVQMNVVNAVNANGVVSGRKVVDFIWQRLAICAMVIGVGCIVAVIVIVIIANLINDSVIRLETEKADLTRDLNGIYTLLGTDNHESAIATLEKDETLTGNDMAKIKMLIDAKYPGATLDMSDASMNLVKTNSIYKVVSLKLTTSAGAVRVIAYGRMSDGQWKLAKYNFKDSDTPCKESSEEEIEALKGIVNCTTEETEKEK